MRVALIVVSMLMVTTPSEASKSCMSRTEARQHFGTVYIYWHGKGRCWDATPPRRYHQIRKVQRQLLQRKVQRQVDQPKWHDSMSKMPPNEESLQKKMSPDEEPVQKPWVNRWVDIESSQPPIVERRVDNTQLEPLPIRKPEPMVTPRGVVMVIIIILLTLAVVMIFEGPQSRRYTQ
jgi:hypothetical protein